MTRFYNPYQFIPLSKPEQGQLVDYEKIANGEVPFVRHDRWEEDALSGRIVCRLKTISPLVIGARQHKPDKEQPAEVIPYREGQALPANALRGMVASVVESISNSALRVLSKRDDHQYFVRRNYKQPLKDIGILLCEGEDYWLYPLTGKKYRVKAGLLSGEDRTYQYETSSSLRKAAINNSWATLSVSGNQEGVLYRRGIHGSMPGKKHEHFIAWNGTLNKSKRLHVAHELVEIFNKELLKRVEEGKEADFPYLPIGYQTPQRVDSKRLVCSGDLIYFKKGNDDQVVELGYSAIWRKPVGNLYDALADIDKNLLPWNEDRSKLTPAEALFGVIEKAADGGKMQEMSRNLASRLRFYDAEAEGTVELLPEQTLRILASPKPPSPSMYFRTSGGGYISKQNLDMSNKKHVPNGRKRYLPHPDWKTQRHGKYHWKTGNNENMKQKLRCCPIPDKTAYWFHIDFENLSRYELDLLRRSIAPGGDFQHQLGLGKPLGLGQVKVEEIGLFLIYRKEARYALEGLYCDRYHSAWRRQDVELPERYPREKAAQVGMQKAEFVVEGNPLIDRIALQKLKQLGSARYLKRGVPVCYPFHNTQSDCEEDKGFEWFVNNDSAPRGQCLGKIEEDKQLPTLDSDTENWQLHRPNSVSATAIQLRLSGIKPRNQRSYDDDSVKQAIVQKWPGTRVIRVNLGNSLVELEPSDAFPVPDGSEWKQEFPVGDGDTLILNPPTT